MLLICSGIPITGDARLPVLLLLAFKISVSERHRNTSSVISISNPQQYNKDQKEPLHHRDTKPTGWDIP